MYLLDGGAAAAATSNHKVDVHRQGLLEQGCTGPRGRGQPEEDRSQGQEHDSMSAVH